MAHGRHRIQRSATSASARHRRILQKEQHPLARGRRARPPGGPGGQRGGALDHNGAVRFLPPFLLPPREQIAAIAGGGKHMIIVVFEVELRPEGRDDYFALAADLREELQEIDGFISIERFQSVNDPGKILSLSTWRDEAAVEAWY